MRILIFIILCVWGCSAALAGTYNITSVGEHFNDNSYRLSLSSLPFSNGPVTGKRVSIVEEYTSPSNQVTTYHRAYENQSVVGFSNKAVGKYKYKSATTCFQFYYSPSWSNCVNTNLNLVINVVRNVNDVMRAESNDGSFGLTYENTTDYGGGSHVTSISDGDYVEWIVSVPQGGFYSVTSRSAAIINARFDVLLNGVLKADMGISKTGGLHSWRDFESASFFVPEGVHKIRLDFSTAGQNLNWIRLVPQMEASIAQIDDALWRIVSRGSFKTLSLNGGSFLYSDYFANANQHWRFLPQSGGGYYVRNELNQQCLNSAASWVVCGNPDSKWFFEVIREKTENHPAIYFLKNNQGSCLSQSLLSGSILVGDCNKLARWYVEPVGFNERNFPQEYEIKSLLIVKPTTNIENVSMGSLSASLIDVVRHSYEVNMPAYFLSMTDGRVKFEGNTIVSHEPIRSLSIHGGCPNWHIPMAQNIPNDVQRYVKQGDYDEVQVFFNSGSLNGGGGCGPGRTVSSNYAMWTTVNGHNVELSDWLDPSKVRSKTEIFIHEPIHGYDDYHESMA